MFIFYPTGYPSPYIWTQIIHLIAQFVYYRLISRYIRFEIFRYCPNFLQTDYIKLKLYILQGVPIKMGIKWRFLFSLQSMWHFFMNTINAEFQLKHIISKTPTLQILKMSRICVSSKLMQSFPNLYKLLFSINHKCLNV